MVYMKRRPTKFNLVKGLLMECHQMVMQNVSGHNNRIPHILCSPGAKLENGGLPYTESPLSFDGLYVHQDKDSGWFRKIQYEHGVTTQIST